MKRSIALLSVSLLAATALAPTGRAQSPPPAVRERIGIYDSRAVAVAYAGSNFQAKQMDELKARLKKAKEAGDAREASRVEAEGKRWQLALSQQGFGTAPVDELLALIPNDLSSIQQSAGVTRLVSKWNKPELGKHPKAERIDVTMELVDAFHPNERQRQWAREIQKKTPVEMKK